MSEVMQHLRLKCLELAMSRGGRVPVALAEAKAMAEFVEKGVVVEVPNRFVADENEVVS